MRGTTDPFALIRKWLRDAERAGEPLPEAMALATATRDGHPSVRVVLNRGISRGGLVFFTNYSSRKAADLVENPRAAIVFHWPALERQLRVEGRVHKLTRREYSGAVVSRRGIRARTGALRRGRDSVPAVLGRFPSCRKLYRVLGGKTVSPARSRRFSTKKKRLDELSTRAVRIIFMSHDK